MATDHTKVEEQVAMEKVESSGVEEVSLEVQPEGIVSEGLHIEQLLRKLIPHRNSEFRQQMACAHFRNIVEEMVNTNSYEFLSDAIYLYLLMETRTMFSGRIYTNKIRDVVNGLPNQAHLHYGLNCEKSFVEHEVTAFYHGVPEMTKEIAVVLLGSIFSKSLGDVDNVTRTIYHIPVNEAVRKLGEFIIMKIIGCSDIAIEEKQEMIMQIYKLKFRVCNKVGLQFKVVVKGLSHVTDGLHTTEKIAIEIPYKFGTIDANALWPKKTTRVALCVYPAPKCRLAYRESEKAWNFEVEDYANIIPKKMQVISGYIYNVLRRHDAIKPTDYETYRETFAAICNTDDV